LELPQEVLMSVMKKHQRYFSIKDSTGKLMDAFITVVNGNSAKVDLDAIRKGNEAVLRARYSDARFFYENDTRDGKTLKEFVPLLDRLTFQENLGSMLDKTNRVVAAIPEVFKYLDTDDTIAKEAAVLIKAERNREKLQRRKSRALFWTRRCRDIRAISCPSRKLALYSE